MAARSLLPPREKAEADRSTVVIVVVPLPLLMLLLIDPLLLLLLLSIRRNCCLWDRSIVCFLFCRLAKVCFFSSWAVPVQTW